MPQPVGSMRPSAALAAIAASTALPPRLQTSNADLGRERLARRDHAVPRRDDGAGRETIGRAPVHEQLFVDVIARGDAPLVGELIVDDSGPEMTL